MHTIKPYRNNPNPRATQSKPAALWKCPFCQGTGLAGAVRCPACQGQKLWEADVSLDFLSFCGRCAGSGRINRMGNWAVCSECHGAGKT